MPVILRWPRGQQRRRTAGQGAAVQGSSVGMVEAGQLTGQEQ